MKYDRVIISGTRNVLDVVAEARARQILASLSSAVGVGDCPTGIDALARDALHGSHELHVFAADWTRLGKRAGPERNGRMVAWAAMAKSPVLVAFPAPDSRGTWDCIRQAVTAGLTVWIEPVMR